MAKKDDRSNTSLVQTQARLNALQNSQANKDTDYVDPDYDGVPEPDQKNTDYKKVQYGPKKVYTSQVTPGDWLSKG
jgi:hypothetical protein